MEGRLRTKAPEIPKDAMNGLLASMMEDFRFYDAISVSDGYGTGHIYKPGAGFKAAATIDQSIQARVAESQDVKSIYTITTDKATNLQFHNVVERLRDGKIFRVTSDGDDNKTPEIAMLDMRQVTAEEWRIPNGQGQDAGSILE